MALVGECELQGPGSYEVAVTGLGAAVSRRFVEAMIHWWADAKPPRLEETAFVIPPSGRLLKRYFLRPSPEGWRELLKAPAGARSACITVHSWDRPRRFPRLRARLSSTPDEPARRPVLAVACQRHPTPTNLETNVSLTARSIRRAGEMGADLLCLSELFVQRGVPGRPPCALNSPLLKPIFEAVRGARLYTVLSVLEKSRGRTFNTALMIAPDGTIAGVYRKTHLAFSEFANGVVPGETRRVVETPFGRVGLLVCWDAWFPETAVELARLGAEIVCLPIAGDSFPAHWETIWRARALDHGVYWMASVTANCAGRAPSRIISPDGKCLAETRRPNAVVTARAALPYRREHFWLSAGPCRTEWRNALGRAREMVGVPKDAS